MRTLFFYLFTFLLLLRSFSGIAQHNAETATAAREEKIHLLRQINDISGDSDIIFGLSHIIETKVDSISNHVVADKTLPLLDKEKAIRSLVYFMQELRENISQRKLDVYEIPAALESYGNVLHALLYHKPFAEFLKPLEPRHSQLLAYAFSQYNGSALLDDIAVYKRVASAPDFILRFLEDKPGFRFADSLLLVAVAYDPVKIVSYLNGDNPRLEKRIRESKNRYVQQIVALSEDKEASELLPFVMQIAEKEIAPGEILEKRLDVTNYFQLLVNTVAQSSQSVQPLIFQKVLRNGLRRKALAFYANPINEQHSAPDAVRFAVVKDLRPEDIYYIITSCGEDLYTSSYLGLYKRLMRYFKGSADSLFSIVHYDNFRVFMRLAANYNTLADFLSNMPQEQATSLVQRFISGIEVDINTGLEKAMDVADCFTGLDSVKEIGDLFQQELQDNLARCVASRQYFGIRLYRILSQVFDQVKQKDPDGKLWLTLGNYEMLPRNELCDKNGAITELVLFYGDEDGMSSFNNFQKLYRDPAKWEITKNEFWISIRSRSPEPMVIYANIPLDDKGEMDTKAQDSLIAFLDMQGIEPSVLVHRGHSYHLCKTLKRLKPSVKLAILGSCGGYNSAISIAGVNPDIQIIGSKKVGSKMINDPIIEIINETLQNKKDLYWPQIWDKLQTRFSKDEFTLNLFNEYIPPGKNVSLFVLKLFNLYNKPADLARF